MNKKSVPGTISLSKAAEDGDMDMSEKETHHIAVKAQPFDTMQYFYGLVQNPVIRCYLYFHGRIDTDRLQEAIRRTISMYPIMRCTFDFKKQEWKESDFSEKKYLSIMDQNKNDNETENENNLSSLEIGIDPPIKINLIHNTNDDFICVMVSHLLCDGRGFEQVLYTLSSFYSGNAVKNDNTDRSFHQIIQKIPLIERGKLLFAKSELRISNAKHHLPFTEGNGTPGLIIKQINPGSFLNLRRYAKTHNVSVNDVFLAAYIKTLHTLFGWDAISLPCPVDLRKFSNGADISVCNLTGNYHCEIQTEQMDTFENILARVSLQMRKQKDSNDCLKEPELFHILYHLMPRGLLKKLFFRIAPVPVLSYSNLGMLDEKKLMFKGTDILNAFISTAVKPVPYFQLSISTYKDICTLSCCTMAKGKDRDMIQKLMNEIYRNLLN